MRIFDRLNDLVAARFNFDYLHAVRALEQQAAAAAEQQMPITFPDGFHAKFRGITTVIVIGQMPDLALFSRFLTNCAILKSIHFNACNLEQDFYDRLPQLKPATFTFDCFFFQSLKSSGYERVSRRTNNIDLFSYQKVLIPIHLVVHWALIAISPQDKIVEYYDSYLDPNGEALQIVLNYLQNEHLKRKQQRLNSGWQTIHRVNIPKQTNLYDCGPFVCRFALSLCKGEEFNFFESDMPEIRAQIKGEIIKGKLD